MILRPTRIHPLVLSILLPLMSWSCGSDSDESHDSGASASTASSTAASTSTSTGPGSGGGGAGGGAPDPGASVLEYHNGPMRQGVILDAQITMDSAPNMHIDSSFVGVIDGAAYAQPLFIDGLGTAPDMILVVTEKNQVYALDAETGREIWKKKVASEVNLTDLPCGSIDPYGITG